MTVTCRRRALPAQRNNGGAIIDPHRTAAAAAEQLRKLRGLPEPSPVPSEPQPEPPSARVDRPVKRIPPPARSSNIHAWTDAVTAGEVWYQAMRYEMTAPQLVAKIIEAVAREEMWGELLQKVSKSDPEYYAIVAARRKAGNGGSP